MPAGSTGDPVGSGRDCDSPFVHRRAHAILLLFDDHRPFDDVAEIERVVIENLKTIEIYLKSLKDGAHCHGCGKAFDCFHGYGQEIELRHLPILGDKVSLVIRPRRYRRELCEGRLTTS
ncbi:hypothetical protein CCR95_00170 [Thiocystis minor]|uniref:transposase family protein n=1 Tax=Thiocystis minor TaxID=61597 RepID=UPI0019144255|nr:transposase family protein [Thiocystis minor]MBK5962565.1 hypothetical protein [Thiocystis minor]